MAHFFKITLIFFCLFSLQTIAQHSTPTVVLFSNYFGKVETPSENINEQMFGRKFTRLLAYLNHRESELVNRFRDTLAKNLVQKTKATILYGDQLYCHPGFEELKLNLERKNVLRQSGLFTSNIILPEEEFNPFPIKNANLYQYFNSTYSRQSPGSPQYIISTIAEELNADYVFISYSSLVISKIGILGLYGSVKLKSTIYIFNKEGELQQTYTAVTSKKKTSASNLHIVNDRLNKYKELTTILAKKVELR